MKKLTALLLVLVTMIALAAPALALQNLEYYASAKFTKNYPVYSGPGEEYYRANSGKALYGRGGKARIYGVVGNWVMMGYGLSNGDYRIGYIAKDCLNNMENLTGNINYNLVFDNQVMYTKTDVPLTDDPIVKCTKLTTVKGGSRVIALGIIGQWAYVELTDQPQKMRGFIRADHLVDQSGAAVPTVTAAPYYPIVTAAPTQIPYYPTATQAPSYTGNALLSGLKHNCPNTGIMLPANFSPYQTTYLLTVADWVSKPTFTPTAYDPNATITVNGQVVRSGQTSQAITMTDKPQAVTISVRSGTASTTYTIYLQRRPSEKRTRVSAGYITNFYTKNNDWHLVADLGTISYLTSDYTTGSRSTFENKTTDSYDYVVSPNCMFYYGTPQNPIRLNTVSEFMNYYRVYGSTLYTIVYIEDEIVAVFPYGAESQVYY
ncbi:MAG: cadherin-like beta sandwich domain-containing protein [Clostridia bacterium]|nr:cadherin-like beta sandwich domain-containing protein [Clostridia bacterium]